MPDPGMSEVFGVLCKIHPHLPEIVVLFIENDNFVWFLNDLERAIGEPQTWNTRRSAVYDVRIELRASRRDRIACINGVVLVIVFRPPFHGELFLGEGGLAGGPSDPDSGQVRS